MPESEIPAWVDSHWEAAAAEIEAGNCDDAGEIIPSSDCRKSLEAYRERIAVRACPNRKPTRTANAIEVTNEKTSLHSIGIGHTHCLSTCDRNIRTAPRLRGRCNAAVPGVCPPCF